VIPVMPDKFKPSKMPPEEHTSNTPEGTAGKQEQPAVPG